MKREHFFCALALMGWATLASAQTEKPKTDKPQAEKPKPTEPAVKPENTKAMLMCHKASNIIGAKVENPAGENLGKVEELVINPSSGGIEYAVLSFGGFLGMGDKLFALPFSLFKPRVDVDPGPDDLAFTLDVDKAKMEKAPGFPKDNWPDLSTTWCDGIDKYYGCRRAAGALEENSKLKLNKASDLMGSNVHNTANEELGEVKELVIDPQAARVNYFVMSSGGVLGIGDKLFAIPWETLKITADEDGDQKLVLNATKERLENAPEFKEKDWDRMSDPVWVEEVYVFYGVRPYWGKTTSEASSPR